jgi:Ca-activated chloride channel homolog
VGVLAAVVVVAAGLVARTDVRDAVSRSWPWAASPRACPSTTVRIVAAQEVVGVVQQVVTPLTGRRLDDGSCLQLEVLGQRGATTVASTSSTADSSVPQVWIPDSSLWATQPESWATATVGQLASSPVVIGASRATVHRLGWDRRAPSWAEALDPARPLLAPGVTDDGAFLTALLAFGRSTGNSQAAKLLIAAAVLDASRADVLDQSGALAVAADDRRGALLVTTEQVLSSAAAARLVPIHPAGATPILDYPVLRVLRGDVDPIKDRATQLVVASLTAPAVAALARAAGLQPGEALDAASARRGAAEQAAVAAVATQIRALAAPSRFLTVVDVSLSMGLPARDGASRIELATQAAIGAGRLLPDASSVGLWTFAARSGRLPYREVAPVERVGLAEGPSTHRDVVNAELARLPHQLSAGGTALYGTALAALRAVRASYEEGASNTVVLFTDGANDDQGGMTLAQFVRAARADAQGSPQQPVRLIAVGIGDQADMDALRRMCAAAGGAAYRADTPQALQGVLLDAITRRNPALGR